MTEPDCAQQLATYLDAGAYSDIACTLLQLELDHGYCSRGALTASPFDALEHHPGVEVVYGSPSSPDCSVAGYFRASSSPPALVVHPSGSYRRDSFTVLHEYGHYVQMAHTAWTDVWLMLPTSQQTKVGERVADAFAAEVLLPSASFEVEPITVTASQLRGVFARSGCASRSAIAYRVLAAAGPADRLMVAVLAEWGAEVLFAGSVGDLMAPRRGAVQPTLRTLALSARDTDNGIAYGDPTSFIMARSGWCQSDVKLEVATDSDGFAFAVARPTYRYAPTTWTKQNLECSNPACGATYEASDSVRHCSTCEEWKCPDCGECACALAETTFCPLCSLQYSVAERDDPSIHECW